jgi:hypothetical protein
MRFLKGCAFVVMAVLLVAFVSLLTASVSAYRKAKRINDANVVAAKPIIDALEKYRQATHRYPATLCDLQLNARPVLFEFTRFFYTSSQDGSEYWLAIFPFLEGHLVMPSDSVNEYSSRSRRWSAMDFNDGKAKGDEAWDRNCGPAGTMRRGS